MKNIISRYFTVHTKNVLIKAEKIAMCRNKKQVEIVDAFLALAQEKGSVGASLIPLIKESTKKTHTQKIKNLPFSRELKTVLLQSLKVAQAFQFPYVGTEHLLYAIVESDDKKTLAVLQKNSIDSRNILNQLNKILSKSTDLASDPLIIIPDQKKKAKKKIADGSNLKTQQNDRQDFIYDVMSDINDLVQSIIDKKGKGEFDPEKTNRQLMRPSFGLVNSGKKTVTKFLDYFSRDLNQENLEGKNDPVVGRDKEIDGLVRILMRKNKNNPVLVGDPGVGKTAIVSGLSQRIIDRNVPESLLGKRIMSLDLGLMVAGTSFRGEFEDRFKRVLEEAENDSSIILFIDELHNIIGAGSAQGSLDAANILKPILARGRIHCIGATTIEEYHKYIEKDGALERRFQPVWVKEESLEDTEKILMGLKPFFEEYHRVKIADGAIKKVVELSNKFMTDRYFPDKALDLLDETAAYVVQDEHQKGASRDFQKLLSQKEKLSLLKEKMVKNNNFIVASSILEEEKLLEKNILEINKKVLAERELIPVVSEMDVAEVLSLKIDIPSELILETIGERLAKMESTLQESIKGQDEALKKISFNLKRTLSGISDPERPATALLLVGPTGVGKTYLAKTLAKELFLRPEALLRIDMSEFSEKHTVARLVGSPPGYVGYGEKNYFSDKVRKNPYSLILFDEIEKAHPEVFNILLQVLEDGMLTDNLGRKINFKNTLIIFTSNLGNDEFLKEVMGFGNSKEEFKSISKDKASRIRKRLEEFLRPELLNRLTDIIYFKPLSEDSLESIARIEIEKLKKRISEKKSIGLFVGEKLIKDLAKKSVDNKEGVRLLRRMIQQKIEEPISEAILSGKTEKNSKIFIDSYLGKKKGVEVKIISPNRKDFDKYFNQKQAQSNPLWRKIRKKSAIV